MVCEAILYQAISLKNYLPQPRGRQHNHMRYTKNYMHIFSLVNDYRTKDTIFQILNKIKIKNLVDFPEG